MRWAGLITKNLIMKTELNKNEKLSTEQETPPIANVLLCDGLSCPDCGGFMEQNDTTYSNVNTSRAKLGQHTGDIYFCEHCEHHYIDNLITGNFESFSY